MLELLDLHIRTRHAGGEDFAAGSLFRALTAVGQKTFAVALFDEYVSQYRRDRTPFEPELADFARTVVSETQGGAPSRTNAPTVSSSSCVSETAVDSTRRSNAYLVTTPAQANSNLP
jgi:hypothetical protein